ncbi:Cytosolic Fe-S cluster assembly factor nar1 [Cryptotrichosporon argae]
MSALKITDLDDFLTPSQACIIPVRGAQTTSAPGETEIHIDDNNNYYEVATYSTATAAIETALQKAEISLNDCLACSGCITSTESMLITLQSHTEVLDFIRASASAPDMDPSAAGPSRLPVLSISPQTLASLSASYAAAYALPPLPLRTLLRRVRARMARHGWRTYDTTFARHVALREVVREYEERRARRRGAGTGTGTAKDGAHADAHDAAAAAGLPMLASACPGWVCYAEKAQGDLLPFMSAVRSPQAVQGALVKAFLGATRWGGCTPDAVYHVTAMPCYDKKLEAARADFYDAVHNARDTDCVLTTGELDLVLAELGFEPYAPVDGDGDGEVGNRNEAVAAVAVDSGGPSTLHSSATASLARDAPFPELVQHKGTSSGSYLHTLLSAVAAAHPGARLTVRELRAPDYVEYALVGAAGDVVFKGAKCYGFRNLQNLVRRVAKETGVGGARAKTRGSAKLSAAVAARRRRKGAAAAAAAVDAEAEDSAHASGATTPDGPSPAHTDDAPLDFVEVMACPGGCVNGGGQMKPGDVDVRVDEEGYARPLPDDGVDDRAPAAASGAVPGPGAGDDWAAPANRAVGVRVDEGMRWSTKAWVDGVEAVYWAAAGGAAWTPPGSPEPRDASADRADEMDATVRAAWGDKARDLLRTHYSKVEGDVLSQGGLTHEQVVW